MSLLTQARTWTRPPAVADLFYAANTSELAQDVDGFLQSAREKQKQNDILANVNLRTLVVPHAGYVYSGEVAARAYIELERLPKKRWKIIVLGPAHRVYVPYVSVAGIKSYQTPLGEICISKVAHELSTKLGFTPEAHAQEHSLEVQLPFLQRVVPDFELIPIVVGGADPETLAQELAPYLDDDTLLVISTDLSHFLNYEAAKQKDAVANTLIPALDIEQFQQQGDACGKVGVLTAMHLAKLRNWQGFFLDYCNSGDTGPDKSRVVGYGAYAMGYKKQREEITQ